MKIKKTLNRNSIQSFFWDDKMHHGLCLNFIKKLLSTEKDVSGDIVVTLSTINPKTKNFRKITRLSGAEILLDSEKFDVCYSEQQILDSLEININDSFWMKAVK